MQTANPATTSGPVSPAGRGGAAQWALATLRTPAADAAAAPAGQDTTGRPR
jgi:hypothetical protein